MSSTLQLQLGPKLTNKWAHFCHEVPIVDDVGNVQNDFFEKGTNKEGFVDAGFVDPRPVWVLFELSGYQISDADGFPINGNVVGPIAMPHDALITVSVVRASQEMGPLRRDGNVFRDTAGQRWQMKGYTCQTLTAEVAHGRDIDACLDEAVSLGYNTIVSLCMDTGEWAQAHGYAVDPRDPNWPRWFETTLNKCEERKLRIFPAMFQQAQALSSAEKRAAWDRYCAVIKGRWHVIGRMGNEKDVNAWDPTELNMNPDLGGCLLSLGSYGINNAPQPPRRDIIEWEPPREPRAKAFSDSGGAGWYMVDGYEGFPAVDGILVVSEPPFFHDSQFDWWGDKRWFKPEDALTLGLNLGANFEGAAFGSSASLECKLNGPGAAECARQFIRGLDAGFQR